jgi:hypothetical protein
MQQLSRNRTHVREIIELSSSMVTEVSEKLQKLLSEEEN